LRGALAAFEVRIAAVEHGLTRSRAVISASDDMIRHLPPQPAKPRREQSGLSSERRARLIEQLKMPLEDLETDIVTDQAKAEAEAPRSAVVAFEGRRPSCKPFAEHPPRERVVVKVPAT
jgi:transposase